VVWQSFERTTPAYLPALREYRRHAGMAGGDLQFETVLTNGIWHADVVQGAVVSVGGGLNRTFRKYV
jgi:hypothetical protein